MRRPRPFSKWSYRIDYDKEIALDQARIALYESDVVRSIAATMTLTERVHLSDGETTANEWLWWEPELVELRAKLLDISNDDLTVLAVLRYCAEGNPEPLIQRYAQRYQGHWGNARLLAQPIEERLQAIPVLTEERRLLALRKAKQDLARHKRRQAKHEDRT